jgi:hypothetical protein
MEHSIRHPSAVLQFITHRHATEQTAMDKATAHVDAMVANYKLTSPKAMIIESSASTTFIEDRGYSAIVRVRVSAV